ncbi:phage tail assembly chaperone [Duganella sp. CT11-25]|uniref:phage tail assembly chaperone n=1 Tax=unclassified Duganella TaxID=2636909 RepID=UPI0039AF70DB
MAIKLGKNPKNFTRDIPLVTMDGVADVLVITYKYRSRLEFAELLDERVAAENMLNAQEAAQAAAIADGAAPVQKSAAEGFTKASKEAAESVLEIATGWDIDDPFTVDKLMELESDFPGALMDIQNMYQAALLEVRRKN